MIHRHLYQNLAKSDMDSDIQIPRKLSAFQTSVSQLVFKLLIECLQLLRIAVFTCLILDTSFANSPVLEKAPEIQMYRWLAPLFLITSDFTPRPSGRLEIWDEPSKPMSLGCPIYNWIHI